MPMSLRCRLKGLARKGYLRDKDIERIFHALDVTEEPIRQKMDEAKETDWLTKGLTEEEIQECINNARKEARFDLTTKEGRLQLQEEVAKTLLEYTMRDIDTRLNKAKERIEKMTLYSDALERECPQECKEIREDEREIVISEMKALIREYERHKTIPHICENCKYNKYRLQNIEVVIPCRVCSMYYEDKWEEKE